jgi:CHASE3 domain sensor protein
VPLIAQVIFVLLLGGLLEQASKQSAYLKVLKEKIAAMEDLYTQPAAMRMSVNSYLIGDRNSADLSQYEQQRGHMREDLEKLKKLTADNPAQRAIIKDLGAEVTDAIRMVDDFLGLLETDPSNWKVKYNITNSQLTPLVDDVMKKVRKFSDELEAEEALTPTVEKDLSDKIKILIWTVVPIDIVAVIVLAAFFNINTTRRLKILMENTQRLANGQPLNAPVKGTDEIADLDQDLHKMAALLNESERKNKP